MTQHTRTDLAELATQTEAFLDAVDPATLEWEDPVELRRVSAASERLGLAVDESARDPSREGILMNSSFGLKAPLHNCERAVGRSWAEVGVVLGVSKQAAQQRFGR